MKKIITILLGVASIYAGEISEAINNLDATSLNNILEDDSVSIDGDDLFILEKAINTEKLMDTYLTLSLKAQSMLRSLILDEKLLDTIDAWENNAYKTTPQENLNQENSAVIEAY